MVCTVVIMHNTEVLSLGHIHIKGGFRDHNGVCCGKVLLYLCVIFCYALSVLPYSQYGQVLLTGLQLPYLARLAVLTSGIWGVKG